MKHKCAKKPSQHAKIVSISVWLIRARLLTISTIEKKKKHKLQDNCMFVCFYVYCLFIWICCRYNGKINNTSQIKFPILTPFKKIRLPTMTPRPILQKNLLSAFTTTKNKESLLFFLRFIDRKELSNIKKVYTNDFIKK